ncbi:MAG: LUD domain-containing protein [Archaeoglobaceae archaeon]
MDREEREKIISMRNAFKTLKERQKNNFVPDLEAREQKLREVREYSVGNHELLQQAAKNLEKNNFKVIWASDSGEAVRQIFSEIGDEKLVVKSKSNVTKEIELTKELSQRGIETVETDVGDRIIQIMNEVPSHSTAPAAHLSSSLIAEKLSDYYGFTVDPSPQRIVEVLRKDIKENMEKAKVGISGANAITAEGAIVLLHNEGNIFEVMNRPEKWIIVTGIDKIYPSIEDAINSAKIQSYYATGNLLPSFIETISGVSKTTDIEKKLFTGIANPKEVVVVLVDNGRRELIENGFEELFYCIGCGYCMVNCPAHNTYGNEFKGGRFALYSALQEGGDSLRLCLSCKQCQKNCPLNINIPQMIKDTRRGSELYYLLSSHLKWVVNASYVESWALYYRLFNRTDKTGQ